MNKKKVEKLTGEAALMGAETLHLLTDMGATPEGIPSISFVNEECPELNFTLRLDENGDVVIETEDKET